MKTLIKTATIAMVLVTFSANLQAKIWRITNIPGDSSICANCTNICYPCTTLTQAIGSTYFTAGDTIYLQPSGTSYGSATITKKVVIIGAGYFFNNPKTQSKMVTSKINYIIFSTGSDGSVLMGCEIISLAGCCTYTYNSITVYANSIILNDNYISTTSTDAKIMLISTGTGTVIKNNYILCQITGGNSNLVISNNYVGNGITVTGDGQITNNVVRNSFSVSNGFYVRNNIYDGTTFIANNCIYTNNIGTVNQFQNIGLNIDNLQNALFTNIFISTGNTTDGNWQLKTNPVSPAINFGYGLDKDGTKADCGMFGGTEPYILSGMPSIPAIYELTVPPSGDIVNGLKIGLKAKAH